MQDTKLIALIPLSATALGGPFETVEADDFKLMGRREKTALVEFINLPDGIEWFSEFDLMFCAMQHDEKTFKVIRAATDAERKLFRVPTWIQDEEAPECCGEPMFFVGQIDDDRLCTEKPKGAKMWWHDQASFYVFTCAKCLECKAVGQQF